MPSDFDRQPREEPGFRLAAGGYVFREPSLWPLGAPNHYVVTSEQKSHIADMLRRRRLFMFAIFLLFVVKLVAQVWDMSRWAFLAATCVLASGAIGVYAYERNKLRTYLSGVPRTNDQITIGEIFEATAATTPVGRLLIWDALCAWWLMRGIMHLAGSTAVDAGTLLSWFGVILFAFGLVYFGSLTAVKFMPRHRTRR